MSITDYVDDLNNSKSSVSYLDSSLRRQVQLPLGISWYTGSGTTDPNDLYTDDPSLYFVYSGGWHQTAISSQIRDRYNGVTITLLEGGPVQVYVQAADEIFRFIQNFYGAPYTTSGDAGSEELILSTYYPVTPSDPESWAVEIPSPGTYKIVFPFATDSQAFTVSHSGAGSYRVSQIIPRRAVQSYDIDVNSIKAYHVTADLIDTISLRVADSIVVGPDLIGAKSIDGSKIVDGTLSGVLIANGTVTGNKVLAGTISGVLIAANSITGNNIAANTITADKVTSSFVDTISAQVSNSLVIGSGQIADKSIDGRKIVDGTVSGVLIKDGTVTGNKIVAGTISGVLITAGTITGDRVAAATISGSLLTAGTITFDKIASNTLTSGQIADGTITGQKIVSGAISGVLITDNAITASKIAAGTITGDKITANTISGALITAGTITSSQIATSGITAINIAANAISADNIVGRTITADKIVLSGITADLLGPEAVTAAALASGAVISGKLAANSVLANNVTAGIIQGYHVAANTISGDKIQANTISGALMTAGTITFDKIASNTLTSGQIANGTITGQNILSGTISGVLITDGTIAASKILANTITTNQIAAGTITGTNIAAATISGSLITAGTITADKLSVTQLDAVAGNMGNLTVNSGINIGTNGYLWAGAGSASTPTTGLKIYTTGGVSRLTTFSGGIAQVDIDSDGKLYAGSGQTLKLDSTGLTFKTAVSGVFVPNSRTGQPEILATVFPPKENLIKFHPYNIQTSYGVPTFYQDTSDSVLAFLESTQLYNTRSNIATSSYTGVKTRFRSGWLPTESGLTSAFTGLTDSIMSIESNAALYASLNLSAGTDYAKAIISLSGHALNYSTINADATYININPTSNLYVTNSSASTSIAGPTIVNNTLTAGNTTISGTLDVASNFKVNNNKFTVVPGNGNTNIAGTLDVAGDVHLGTGAHTMKFDASTGNATFDGTLDVASNFKVNTNKFTVAPATGNTTISGSLSIRGDLIGTGTKPFLISAGGKFNYFTGNVAADSFSYSNGGGASSPWYGGGFDSSVTFDGTTADKSNFSTYNSANSTYTLTRDLYAQNVTINLGITVVTAGFRIFAQWGITVNGYLHNKGGDASGIVAGVGASGGYFKAAGAGAAGLGAASAGASGAVAPLATAATLVGALGGRGAAGRLSVTTFAGREVSTKANFDLSTPALVDGGRSIINNVASWHTRALNTATTLWQMTSATGGSSGSKSATGTSATSGAGGGGGGFMLLASPNINGTGTISVEGGVGGNAAGTGGNFGGGGGGGGGIIAIITDHSNYPMPYGSILTQGGLGGTSVSNLISPVAYADSSTASTTATTVTLSNANAIPTNTLHILSIHVQGTSVVVPTAVVTGGSMNWTELVNLPYATDAVPTRRLQVFAGIRYSGSNYSDDPLVKIVYDYAPVSARHTLDAVQNTVLGEFGWFENSPVTATTNSATSISTNLGYVPTTNYMQYTVVARSGGTAPVAGTGNTLLNNQTVAPLLVSEVTINRQTNSMSWTTAAAAAAVTIDIPIPSVAESGMPGEDGKFLLFEL